MKRGKPLKRTPLARKSPMKGSATRRSKRPVRQVSAKRDSEREERNEVRQEAMLRARWQCEARALRVMHHSWPSCSGPLDVDEIIARSAWPGGHLILGNVQVLCRAHHDWKHAHPEMAKSLGMTRESWERPEPGGSVELRIW